MLFAQEYNYEVSGSISPLLIVVWLAVSVLMVVSVWRIFTKAGQPGWAAIIPIYNTYIMLKTAGKPGWWLVLLFIPFANIVVLIILVFALARSFGKGGGFGLGLLLLPFIFFPILAFGSVQFQGAVALPTAPSVTPPAPQPPVQPTA